MTGYKNVGQPGQGTSLYAEARRTAKAEKNAAGGK